MMNYFKAKDQAIKFKDKFKTQIRTVVLGSTTQEAFTIVQLRGICYVEKKCLENKCEVRYYIPYNEWYDKKWKAWHFENYHQMCEDTFRKYFTEKYKN